MASFICGISTKVKEAKSFRVTQCFPHYWLSSNNYSFSPRGRIWIARDPHIWTCSIISSSAQQITTHCINSGGLLINISVVYGDNFESRRSLLWRELISISDLMSDTHWTVLGDFNSVRFTNERIGGRRLAIAQLRNFNDCLDSCGLSDV